ncbi:hypothetical protein DTL21_07585 [Bremerella cremea]|uniref:Uncharacterized protein n=1 Tax=Blastopirellula marina TaxID=124 RepID=A0A2S8G029_9BACT|nr:hypothetical protein C5Y83_07585 [Blastopirellula marina]RCS50184.1 hypothetical protein DTL21_07585 [Bremerella cremea]
MFVTGLLFVLPLGRRSESAVRWRAVAKAEIFLTFMSSRKQKIWFRRARLQSVRHHPFPDFLNKQRVLTP